MNPRLIVVREGWERREQSCQEVARKNTRETLPDEERTDACRRPKAKRFYLIKGKKGKSRWCKGYRYRRERVEKAIKVKRNRKKRREDIESKMTTKKNAKSIKEKQEKTPRREISIVHPRPFLRCVFP